MTLTLRDFRPSDAKAVADLRRAVLPSLIFTPQGIAWHVANAAPAQRLRLFVAVLDGRVTGSVTCGLVHDSSVTGQAVATPCVHPGHRRTPRCRRPGSCRPASGCTPARTSAPIRIRCSARTPR